MISSTLIFNSEFFTDYLIYNDESHQEYLVQVDHEEQTVKCDCPDFKFRKQSGPYGCVKIEDEKRHCKHIRRCLDGEN